MSKPSPMCPTLLGEWAEDIRRTVSLTRETIDATREAMAEADRILAGERVRRSPAPDTLMVEIAGDGEARNAD